MLELPLTAKVVPVLLAGWLMVANIAPTNVQKEIAREETVGKFHIEYIVTNDKKQHVDVVVNDKVVEEWEYEKPIKPSSLKGSITKSLNKLRVHYGFINDLINKPPEGWEKK